MTSAYKLVFGILGNMTALSLLGSPTRTFWGIIRVKKVGDFSCDPYVTAVVNALLWVVYGSPSVKLQVLVLTINSTGAALEFLYIVIYCVYAPRERRVSSFTFSLDSVIFVMKAVHILKTQFRVEAESTGMCTVDGWPVWNFGTDIVSPSMCPCRSKISECIIDFVYAPRACMMRVVKLFVVGMLGYTLATSLFLGLDWNQEHWKIFFGVLCGLFCTIMYAAPLSIKMMVIKTKSVEYMPFLLSLFVFLNATVWFAYAIIPEMDVPNGLGMLLGGGQLILYGIYFRSTPWMQHVAPQEKLAAITVSDQPKDLTYEVIREGTKEGVRDKFAEESKEGAQGQEQTQRKITGPHDV